MSSLFYMSLLQEYDSGRNTCVNYLQHEACNHGHVAIAEMLLDNGALIDLLGGLDHDTPLHDAVANSRSEVVRLLVQRGAPLTARY